MTIKRDSLRALPSIAAIAFATMLVGACAALQPAPQQAAHAAQRVLSAYNVADLLARADTVLNQSLRDKLPADMSSAQNQQLQQAIADGFETSALKAAVQKNLADQAVQTQHVQALRRAADALDSPLAQQLRGLQASVGDDGFASAYNAFIQQPPDAAREARLEQINALIDDMAIIDLQSAFHVALLDTVLKTHNALPSADDDTAPIAVDEQLDGNRAMLRKQLQQQLPPLLLYAYRDVSDADFAKYVSLQDSPALTWTNRALAKAVGKALRQAGKKIPKLAASL